MFINNSSSFHSVQLGCSLFAFRKIVIKHQLWREILIISRNVELSNCVATSAAKCQSLFYCGFRWTLARGKQEQHQDNSWVTMLPNKWWSTSEYSYLKTFETSPCWMYCLIKGSCNHEPMTHNFFFNNSKLGSITSVKSIASAHSPDCAASSCRTKYWQFLSSKILWMHPNIFC